MAEIDDLFNNNFGRKIDWRARQQKDREFAYKKMEKKTNEVANDIKELIKYLDIQRKFEMYSVGNCLLIQEQMPNATLCREAKNWQKDGVIVKRSDKSIIILEPSEALLQEDGSSKVYYNPKRVYDISSTNAPRVVEKNNYSINTILRALGRGSPLEIKALENIGVNNKVAVLNENKNEILVKIGSKVEDMIQEIVVEMAKYYLRFSSDVEITNLNFKSLCVGYMFCKKFDVPFPIEGFEKLKVELAGLPKEIREELSVVRDTYSTIKARTEDALDKMNRAKQQVR